MVKITLDSVEIEASAGSTILAAADAAGVYIPRLCSHPDLPPVDPATLQAWPEVHLGPMLLRRSEGARADGGAQEAYEGCQLCLVEIVGESEPVRSCCTVVTEGMRCVTSSATLRARRRSRLGEIFSSHPHACLQCAQQAGCSQEPCSTNVAKEERCCPIFHDCELRRVAAYVGIPDDTPRYRPPGLPLVDDEPIILRDHNLCIGCLRCVRMCRDVRKVDALGFLPGEGGKPLVGTRAATLLDSGCQFCLSCVEVCPTGTLRLKFDDPRLDGDRVARCVASCPASIDVPRYLREISRGEFARAEAVVRQAAPLPRVLGQVCFHPCEEHCLRTELSSKPVAICALKRAATEHMNRPAWKSALEPSAASGKTVAVVGAGPAGLAAAWFLRLKGHGVVVYDSQSEPGGWLRHGIPRYRLSPAALDADVADIVGIGVQLVLGVEVGKDVDFSDLRVEHDAVFIAAGARKAKELPCPGGQLTGVQSGLAMLKDLVLGAEAVGLPFSGENIVVIGGGNVAMDVARTALRLGSAAVHLYCLEAADQMPAHAWEIAAAEHEGVVMHSGWGPLLIAGESRVTRVDFHRCTSVFDAGGRFAPDYDESVTASQVADRVLVAIGQEPALAFLDGLGIGGGEGTGTVIIDADSLQTHQDGVFAGGEVVTGPASVVEAVAQGRRAAAAIDLYLGGDGDLSLPLLDETAADQALNPTAGIGSPQQTAMPHLSVPEAVGGFQLVEQGYDFADAVREAGRCLQCDLRLVLRQNPAPPEPWLEFTPAVVGTLPSTEGVYQLLDENKEVYAIKGVIDLRAAMSDLLDSTTKARYFLYDQDPLYSKRESELIQGFLQRHGRMPSGEGEDDLDDLFD